MILSLIQEAGEAGPAAPAQAAVTAQSIFRELLALWKPPRQPDHPDPTGAISPGWTPTARGPNQPK